MSYVSPFADEECCAAGNDVPVVGAGYLRVRAGAGICPGSGKLAVRAVV